LLGLPGLYYTREASNRQGEALAYASVIIFIIIIIIIIITIIIIIIIIIKYQYLKEKYCFAN